MAGELLAKTFRKEVVPALAKQVGDQQFGPLPVGGTVFPSLAVTWCLQRAKTERRPVAILFLDLEAAFYSVLPEVTLGRLLSGQERVTVMDWLGISSML